MRIFCELRSIFPSPTGARKNTSNEQNVHSYYMLNHRIRDLLFHFKKNCYFTIGFYFLVKVFRNILIPSVRMTLTMSKMFARIICQTIEWEVNYFNVKEKCYVGFYFLIRVSKTPDSVSHSCSFCFRQYSPCCKPVKLGHYSVLRPRILRVLLTVFGKMT